MRRSNRKLHHEFQAGLCFTADVSFFFSPRDLRAPWADLRETLPRYRKVLAFDKLGPKILGGGLPQKSWGPKTCKMWVDFGPLQSSIANISGTERHVIDSDCSSVRRKKSGELRSTNNAVLQALSDPPKSTFSEDHISAPKGALPAQIFTCARE